MADHGRFRNLDRAFSGGSKVLSRSEVVSGPEAKSTGAFLGRLWALFGPARPVDNGFQYVLRDEKTQIMFHAYSGASGPSYGAMASREELLPVVRAFEELLAATPPVDCAMETYQDIEYGDGPARIGVRGGKPFEETVKKKRARPLRSAKSFEDCVAMATERADGYRIIVGWQFCLEEVLPDLPSNLVIEGRRYENCVGFTFSRKDDAPVFLFDEGPGLEEIAVTKIPWKDPLTAAANLWLASYDRWRTQKPVHDD